MLKGENHDLIRLSFQECCRCYLYQEVKPLPELLKSHVTHVKNGKKEIDGQKKWLKSLHAFELKILYRVKNSL